MHLWCWTCGQGRSVTKEYTTASGHITNSGSRKRKQHLQGTVTPDLMCEKRHLRLVKITAELVISARV